MDRVALRCPASLVGLMDRYQTIEEARRLGKALRLKEKAARTLASIGGSMDEQNLIETFDDFWKADAEIQRQRDKRPRIS